METMDWILEESPDDVKPFVRIVYELAKNKKLASQLLYGLRQAELLTKKKLVSDAAVLKLMKMPGRGEGCLELFLRSRAHWQGQ